MMTFSELGSVTSVNELTEFKLRERHGPPSADRKKLRRSASESSTVTVVSDTN